MKEIIDSIFNEQLQAHKSELLSRASQPKLAIVTVGEDPASQVYVRNKMKLLSEAGVDCLHIVKDAETTTQSDLDLMVAASDIPLLFQLPMPNGLQAPDLPLARDVDAFGLEAMSRIMHGTATVLPCTVQAVLDIIESCSKPMAGLKVAVVGRSNIVGKPLVVELINQQATVSSFNSKSDLSGVEWGRFDVVVVATGSHGVVKASMFNKGQLVIDVGINRIDGKLVGDVEHDESSDADITPVPGGVGRLTVMNVLGNLIKLTKEQA